MSSKKRHSRRRSRRHRAAAAAAAVSSKPIIKTSENILVINKSSSNKPVEIVNINKKYNSDTQLLKVSGHINKKKISKTKRVQFSPSLVSPQTETLRKSPYPRSILKTRHQRAYKSHRKTVHKLPHRQ